MSKPTIYHAAAAMVAAAVGMTGSAVLADEPSPFATVVLDYAPAPGQFVNDPDYRDPFRALGPPVGGGTITPDLSSLVSLGGFGGSITLSFDGPLPNLPPSATNRLGLDLIVFGNATFAAGNPTRRFAESGTIEVSFDANENGVPDDAWFLIPGSHLPPPPPQWPLIVTVKTWDADTDDPVYPPDNPNHLPSNSPAPPGTFETTGFRLPALFEVSLLIHPDGSGATMEQAFGYADSTPTLRLGDLNADNTVDNVGISPEAFYTQPDDPFVVGISAHCGGGDAVDFEWAVDPQTGAPAALTQVHFVRITTAVDFLAGPLGELSTEIDAVARVIPPRISDFDRSRVIDLADLIAFLGEWLPAVGGPSAGSPAELTLDGVVDLADLVAFLQAWLPELGT